MIAFNMNRPFGMYVLGLVFLMSLLASCQERMVCPAYQSTYILNDSVRSQFFSRFERDSLPKRYAKVDKTAYGLIRKSRKSEKLREIRTVAMKDILPPKQEPDSSLSRVRSLEELNRMRDELEEPASNQ